jgi:hypothetical protein
LGVILPDDFQHNPLLAPGWLLICHRLREWSEIPAERLQETLAAANPIRCACHTARKMVAEHSALVSGLSETTGRPVRQQEASGMPD